jgi:hypothetical protein
MQHHCPAKATTLEVAVSANRLEVPGLRPPSRLNRRAWPRCAVRETISAGLAAG